jgi:hypothetical protein
MAMWLVPPVARRTKPQDGQVTPAPSGVKGTIETRGRKNCREC